MAHEAMGTWARTAPTLPITAPASGLRRSLNRWNVGVFLVSCAVLLGLAEHLVTRLGITGDEPWYLLQSYAILHLHSVNLAPLLRNHTIYTQFLGAHPDDHTRDYLGHGERVLVNMPGYAAAIAPFYLIGGRPLVVAFQALVASLTGALVFGEAQRVYGSRKIAVLTWLAYLAPLPVLLYAGQIFPSTLAACATFLGFVAATRYLAEAQGRRLTMVSALVSLLAFVLPWLHSKYALVGLLVGGTALIVLRPRLHWPPARGSDRHAWYAAATIAGCTVLSLVLIAMYSHHYFGTWIPPNSKVPPDLLHPRFADVGYLYGQMFLDPRTGLVAWVPIDLLVLPGLALLLRQHPRQGRYVLAFLIAQLALFVTVAVSPIFQGYALIARFTLECTPFFALCIGAVFAAAERSWRPWRLRFARVGTPRQVAALGLLLLGMTVWFAIVGEQAPQLLYPAATVRLVTRYPVILPGPWFALFPRF